MSYQDYQIGKQIEMRYDSDDFYGLLQGLFRLADSNNCQKLKDKFPDIWEDLQIRYNSPGGLLSGERKNE